jgi:NADPH:quinone reductase-like Zn-dependent oxidoreductase
MKSDISKEANVIRFTETGGPEVLRIERAYVPAPGPNEVRVLVKAIGLNRADSMYRQGFYPETPVFPSTLGYDASGVIEATGTEVEGLQVGDQVNVIGLFSLNQYGTYGELILLPAFAVRKFSPRLSFEEAASVWTSYLSMYGLLVDLAKVRVGQYVLINAASSSAGLATIQLANVIGAIPIAITRSASKKNTLLKAGAAHVIVSSSNDIAETVKAITSGKGADIIIDSVGGTTFPKLVSAAAERGQIFVYGALSQDPTPFPLFEVLTKRPVIQGYSAIDILTDPQALSRGVDFINGGIEGGKLNIVIDKIFPFTEIVEATRYLESNAQTGKVVVKL